MRIPNTPPSILPPAEGPPTLWSVMIPVYNCSAFLPELLESILVQAMNDTLMQIEVIDDCSNDGDVASIVSTIGKGRITYFRQPQNVGSLRNFETCINRSRGKYVHLLHGDDKLLPGFYEEMTRVFDKFPEIGAAFCAHEQIEEDGRIVRAAELKSTEPVILESWLEMEAEWQRTQYVAMVVKRSVYEHLGGFYGVTYGEDWEMWARIGKHYPVAYNPSVLAQYRQHDNSISGQSYASGSNLRDITKVINTINTYLPPEKRKRLRAAAKKNYAYYAVSRKSYIWKKNRRHPANVRFFIAVLKMHTDLKIIGKICKLSAHILLYRLTKIRTIHYNSSRHDQASL